MFNVAWFFGVSVGFVFTIRKQISQLIIDHYTDAIKMPTAVDELELLSPNWSKFTRLEGVVAAAGGCHFPIRLPVGGENESY